MEKNKLKYRSVFVVFLIIIFGSWNLACAHQPRLVGDSLEIKIPDPEISRAYYGELNGRFVKYEIEKQEPFILYVNLLVPKVKDIGKDISAKIYKDGSEIAFLNGINFEWKEFYEPFGGDYYYEGPEFKESVAPGKYTVEISSRDNLGKYVVAIGEKEEFPLKEIVKTLTALPYLKINFFEKSVWEVIFGRVGLIFAVFLVLLAGIFLLAKKIRRVVLK